MHAEYRLSRQLAFILSLNQGAEGVVGTAALQLL
jgi:hypothetical protein